MKLLELDSHPLIESFRKQAADFTNQPTVIYHLLLPPEYNIPADCMNPMQYLFEENPDNRGVLVQHGNSSFVLKIEDNLLIPQSGFGHTYRSEILQTTPCTTTNGFSFDMHEIDMNPFQPSPVPPLCQEIQEAYINPPNCISFLRTRIRSLDLPRVLDALEEKAKTSKVTIESKDDIVMMMQESMDELSDIVFDIKPFHYIPTIFKVKTNFIIFFAVTSLFHARLLKVYHDAFSRDNMNAQKAMREHTPSIADPDKLTKAAFHIRSLHLMKDVADGVKMVQTFFEGVIQALPGKDAAADDILPAVCDGMSRATQLSSHLVSSFQYLAEIWPSMGLDEKTTYMLVTCSVAATHFGTGQTQKVPSPPQHTLQVDKHTEDAIGMLEDLLSI